ncbi:hypothetical protein C0Q70_14630 [Pomacea canaliculata]|uniref:Inositol-pentakisphosphate 2-kinase n=1 Tax=Pomacea canaliculata TaxID=400727 RepID=A0A2T7NSL2_POMCA|nr:hypothetical protein C0Q70_14630 [Pomacea canaliculata]
MTAPCSPGWRYVCEGRNGRKADNVNITMEWRYRGEGNCSLVVADPLSKRVYRLLKQNYTRKFQEGVVDSESKAQAVHEDLAQVVSYVRWVMQPLLSPDYVTVPKLTKVEQDFIREVVRQVSKQRPVRRMKKPGDRVDEEVQWALILPDFCFVHLPHGRLSGAHSTISIEIKPKKSFITTYPKRGTTGEQPGVCKFCMHQHLKRQSGQWPETSNYCPLDLFSGNKQRMKHALQSLIKTPQNNLKIWKDGEDVYSAEKRLDLADILQRWFNDPTLKKSRAISCFLDLVIEILMMSVSPDDPQPHSDLTRSPTLQRCQSSSFTFTTGNVCQWLPEGSVLERVYAAQLLDDLEVMNVFPLREWGFDGHFPQDWLLDSEAFRNLDPSSIEWVVQKVKRFLVSKTLQDCSIMVAILPLDSLDLQKQNGPGENHYGNNRLQFDQQWYKVSVALVDLDPKPLDKIPVYHKQASAILASFHDTCMETATVPAAEPLHVPVRQLPVLSALPCLAMHPRVPEV